MVILAMSLVQWHTTILAARNRRAVRPPVTGYYLKLL
jgi:hypothetical protein